MKSVYMILGIVGKLLKVINALGMEQSKCVDSVKYLASETILICSNRKTLVTYYNTYKNIDSN